MLDFKVKCYARFLPPHSLLPLEKSFLVYPKFLWPQTQWGHMSKATAEEKEETQVLTRYPWHELQGPQDAHSPEGPQVHVCVEVGSCRGQDAADRDTEGQGYHRLAFLPCSTGEDRLKKDQPGEHTELMPAACGRTWAWVNHRWFCLELNLATSGFYFAKKENFSSHQNPSSKSWVEDQLPSICPIPASKPCPLLSSLFLTNLQTTKTPGFCISEFSSIPLSPNSFREFLWISCSKGVTRSSPPWHLRVFTKQINHTDTYKLGNNFTGPHTALL